jgi:hypothetical protein
LERRVQEQLSAVQLPDRVEIPALGRALRWGALRSDADGLVFELLLEPAASPP